MVENQEDVIIYNTVDGKASVALYALDGQVWMSQFQLSELFDTSKSNISKHIAHVLEEGELNKDQVVRDYVTTSTDGKQYDVIFYSLEMVLAIGFRVRSKRGTQFRIWANKNLKEFLIKGFLVDDERLKNANGRPDYFDELLERIRDIRASEKRFYQKVRDLFSLSTDYNPSDKSTQMFFAETQNKMLYAVTGRTAAELVLDRASSEAPNMGLTSWKGSIVRVQDIFTAKNYLSRDEIDTLNRLVVIFLENAELRAKEKRSFGIKYWRNNVDRMLEFNEKKILTGSGAVSKSLMEKKVREVYNQFDKRRRLEAARQADLEDLSLLELDLKKR